jgi:ABC-2 type transport system permease protein
MERLLIKNFFRSKGVVIGLGILLVAGLISLKIGKEFQDKNQRIIEKTAQVQQDNIDRYVGYYKNAIGKALYFIRFGIKNETSNLSGLSIGQRDINPSIACVSITSLEGQKYTGELINPMYKLLGNMDFSFVLIYFFPLIIIAFCFNLFSEEKEGGTWSLILTQSQTPAKILRVKIGIRIISIFSILMVLLVSAKFYLDISLNTPFLTYTLIAVLYLCFWFSLCWLVISFRKNSNANALILLLSWIVLTIVVPASINAAIIRLYPISEAYNTVLDNREGVHDKWDKDRETTVKQFKELYPEFNEYKHPKNASFSWLWFYASQEIGDVEAQTSAIKLREKLQKRDTFSRYAGMLFPTIHTQLSLNTISLSDSKNFMNYIEELEQFHKQKRLHFYPKIFTNSSTLEEDWHSFPIAKFQDKVDINWLKTILPFLLIIGLCLIISKTNFSKISNV